MTSTCVCIDTHALVWYLTRPKRLAKGAARVLRRADAARVDVLIPAIVLCELALLREAGRRVVGIAEIEALLAARPNFALFPLDREQGKEFAMLSGVADPFDRIIMSAARVAEAPLVTADTEIADSGLVEVIWE